VGNQTQTYALYRLELHAKQEVALLYAFDPGARGVTCRAFQRRGREVRLIVVGSNNSRNGPMQVSIDAWKAIWDDTHDRLSIDEGRVYLTGFSGGARTAVYFASACKDCIAGVIGGGAGFPNGVPPTNATHFIYFGIVGLDDFNFPEMRALDEALTKVGVPHQVRTWSAGMSGSV
jgi:predicted esterase